MLPAGELDAIEEHTIGISAVADELRAAGQHVKLLYGPPGTGKTHTISYLLGRMTGRTTTILSGGAVSAIGQAGSIARHLQPTTIVIEDVDLIGMDRGLPGGEHNTLLFQLLNEMDGLAEDAGRVDQAVELSLPDDAARRRLVELYTGASLDGDGDELVASLLTALDAMLEHATPVLRSSLAGP